MIGVRYKLFYRQLVYSKSLYLVGVIIITFESLVLFATGSLSCICRSKLPTQPSNQRTTCYLRSGLQSGLGLCLSLQSCLFSLDRSHNIPGMLTGAEFQVPYSLPHSCSQPPVRNWNCDRCTDQRGFDVGLE